MYHILSNIINKYSKTVLAEPEDDASVNDSPPEGGEEFDLDTGETLDTGDTEYTEDSSEFSDEGGFGGGGGSDFGGPPLGGGGGFEEDFGGPEGEGEEGVGSNEPTNIFEKYNMEKEKEDPWVEDEDYIVDRWYKQKTDWLNSVKPIRRVHTNDTLLGEI